MVVGWKHIWVVAVLHAISCGGSGPQAADLRDLASGGGDSTVARGDTPAVFDDTVQVELSTTSADLDQEIRDGLAAEGVEVSGDLGGVPGCPLAANSSTTVVLHDGGPVSVAGTWSLGSGGTVVAVNVTGSSVYWNGEELAGAGCGAISGCADGLLLRLGESFDLQWVRRVGGPGTDRLRAVVELEDGRIAVVGETDSPVVTHGEKTLPSRGQLDGLVLLFEADGSPAWGGRTGGIGDDGWNVVASAGEGALYVGGWFESPEVQFGNAVHESMDDNCILMDCGDLLLARLAKTGEITWSRSFGGTQGERFGYLGVAGSELVAGGSFGSWSLGFAQSVLTLKETICGPMFGCSDLFLARFSSAGEALWAQGYGGDLLDVLLAGTVAPNGGQFLVGEFSSSGIDFGGGTLVNNGGHRSFVAAMEAAGGHRWSLGVDAPVGAVAVGDKEVYVAGVRSAFHEGWGDCLPPVGRQRVTVAGLDLVNGAPLAVGAMAESGDGLTVRSLSSSAGGLVISGGVDGTLKTAQGDFNAGGSAAVFLQNIVLPLTPSDDVW